jgi:hypothetical protein
MRKRVHGFIRRTYAIQSIPLGGSADSNYRSKNKVVFLCGNHASSAGARPSSVGGILAVFDSEK